MITLITRETVEHINRAAPALERALKETTLNKTWTMQGLVDHIVNYQAYAFLQEESQYAGVFLVTTSPLMRSLYFFWSGKARGNKTPINHQEVDDFLVSAAQALQCKEIICEGRKGWGKVIAPYGYTPDSVLYIKEVPHELPEIQPTASDGCEPPSC